MTADLPCHGTHRGDTEPPRGNPIWCSHCLDRIHAALNRLPDLAVHLAERRDGHLNTPTSRVERQPAMVDPPTNSPAWDAADELIWWARGWSEAVAKELAHHGPTRITKAGNPARNLTECVRYLQTHLEQWARIPEVAEELGDEALDHENRSRAAAGRSRLVHRLPGVCMHCEHRSLRRDDGSETVYCCNEECGKAWLWDDYDRLAHAHAVSRAQSA